MNAFLLQRLHSFKFFYFFALSFALFVISCKQQSGKASETVNPADTIKPDDNRFTPVVLTAEGALDEPMNFEVVERRKGFYQ